MAAAAAAGISVEQSPEPQTAEAEVIACCCWCITAHGLRLLQLARKRAWSRCIFAEVDVDHSGRIDAEELLVCELNDGSMA